MSKPTTYEYKGLLATLDDLQSPVWTLRLCPAVALVCLLLAESVFRTGFLHGFCIGLATGTLIGAVIIAFKITSFNMQSPESSEIDDLSVTH